jgi:hypothetical protein
MRATRTDRLRAAIEAELEDQRPALDAGTPLTSVSVIVHLHASGDVRRVQVRADRQRDVCDADRRLMAGRRNEGR